jgi:hypothetical protein
MARTNHHHSTPTTIIIIINQSTTTTTTTPLTPCDEPLGCKLDVLVLGRSEPKHAEKAVPAHGRQAKVTVGLPFSFFLSFSVGSFLPPRPPAKLTPPTKTRINTTAIDCTV